MKKQKSESAAFAALERRDIQLALSIRNELEGEKSIFEDISVEIMTIIIDPDFIPKVFEGATPSKAIRIGAAATELWGTSRVHRMEGAGRFLDFNGADEAAVMSLWSAAVEKRRLINFAEIGIEFVELLSSGRDDEAAICSESNGMIFRLKDVPEIPHIVGEGENPCGCLWIASEQELTEQVAASDR